MLTHSVVSACVLGRCLWHVRAHQRGVVDVHGAAGTAVLMNLSVLHRASAHSTGRAAQRGLATRCR
eukprot:COSAG01_NODE_6471_length_3646_cov_1.377784_3_plen_66_part_00